MSDEPKGYIKDEPHWPGMSINEDGFGTHYEGCDKEHLPCALVRIAELEEKVERLRWMLRAAVQDHMYTIEGEWGMKEEERLTWVEDALADLKSRWIGVRWG